MRPHDNDVSLCVYGALVLDNSRDAYCAAKRVIAAVRIDKLFERDHNVGIGGMGLTRAEIERWCNNDARDNCVHALEIYTKAYPEG